MKIHEKSKAILDIIEQAGPEGISATNLVKITKLPKQAVYQRISDMRVSKQADISCVGKPSDTGGRRYVYEAPASTNGATAEKKKKKGPKLSNREKILAALESGQPTPVGVVSGAIPETARGVINACMSSMALDGALVRTEPGVYRLATAADQAPVVKAKPLATKQAAAAPVAGVNYCPGCGMHLRGHHLVVALGQ